ERAPRRRRPGHAARRSHPARTLALPPHPRLRLGRLRGLLATMRRTAFFFGFVAPWLWAGALHAQSPSTNACAQIESELVIQRARAEQLEQTLGSLEGTIAELRAAEARLGQAVAAAEQCRAERQEFCTATQNFAKGLAQGRL